MHEEKPILHSPGRQIRPYQMSIISLEILLTGIILLHAHPQVVYCTCVKFHQYGSSRSVRVALTRPVATYCNIGLSNGKYLPWNISDRDNPSSCTSSGCVMQQCKVSLVWVQPFRRSCAYRTYGQAQTDGQGGQSNIPPKTLDCRGYNKRQRTR